MMLRQIVGISMLPNYRHGTVVVGWRWFRPSKLQPGRVIIAQAEGREIIKRINRRDGDRFYVIGDNPAASIDSRTFGWLERRQVLAIVTWPRR